MPKGEERLRTEEGLLNQCGGRVKERRRQMELTADMLCARLDIQTEGRWKPKRDDLYKIESAIRLVSDLELIALARSLDVDVIWLLLGAAPARVPSQTPNI